jgi:tetratricopeptide (TPR) repeat protein
MSVPGLRLLAVLAVAHAATGCEPRPPRRPAPRPKPVASAPRPAASAPRPADDAQRSLELGTKLQSEKSFVEAIVAYEQAYRLGRDPRALFGSAQCYRATHRPAIAYENYERILAAHDAELTPQQKQTVQKALAELATQTGVLIINVSEADAEVEIDGKSWGKSPAMKHHRIHTGTHTVHVQKAGFSAFDAEVPIAADESKVVEARLVADKAAAPPANDMTDAEKRSAARAAFQEGTELQEKGRCVEAIPRFQAAQHLLEAPTHLLHLAQCLGATGKVLDAQEIYEALVRTKLEPQAPDAFVKARATARAELPAIKARVPTLRLQTSPAASSLDGLVVQINGTRMPTDLLGVARPMNPGPYRIEATAGALHATTDVDLKEHAATSIELHLR